MELENDYEYEGDCSSDSEPPRKRPKLSVKDVKPVQMQVKMQAKIKKEAKTRLTPFRLIKELFKAGKAEEIYSWICNALQSEREAALNYAINQFFDMDRIDLIDKTFTYLNVNFYTIENLELGILLIRYYLYFNNHEAAIKVVENLTLKSDCLIRKRHIELIVEFYHRNELHLAAYELYDKFYTDRFRFNVTVEDVIPFLHPTAASVKMQVLSSINHKSLYFPSIMAFNFNYIITSEPPADLVKIPIDTTFIAEKIKELLPFKKKVLKAQSGEAHETELARLLSHATIEEASCKVNFKDISYVIDGANVLFSVNSKPHPELLYKMMQDVSLLGPVVVVLHQRHFKNGIVDFKRFSMKNVQVCITPYGVNDDYYSLYVSLINNAILITNDLFRDHIFKIDPMISLWHKEYVANYNERLKINYPLPFSHRVQFKSKDNTFYLPTSDPSEWIIIKL